MKVSAATTGEAAAPTTTKVARATGVALDWMDTPDYPVSFASLAFLPFSVTIQRTSGSGFRCSAWKTGRPAAGSAATATLQP